MKIHELVNQIPIIIVRLIKEDFYNICQLTLCLCKRADFQFQLPKGGLCLSGTFKCVVEFEPEATRFANTACENNTTIYLKLVLLFVVIKKIGKISLEVLGKEGVTSILYSRHDLVSNKALGAITPIITYAI